MLVTAVRAKAIVRSSVLCSLDELCKTFLFKRHMLKILRKTSTKPGGLSSSKGKACRVMGKELRAQNYNCSKRYRCPSKLITFLRCLAEVARVEGDCMVRAGEAPAPAGEGSYGAPHPAHKHQAFWQLPSAPRASIRTLSLNQSCFPD